MNKTLRDLKKRKWRVRNVAKKLGVTPDTIYSYFKARKVSLRECGGMLSYDQVMELRSVYEGRKKKKSVTDTEYKDLCYLFEMTADEVQREFA